MICLVLRPVFEEDREPSLCRNCPLIVCGVIEEGTTREGWMSNADGCMYIFLLDYLGRQGWRVGLVAQDVTDNTFIKKIGRWSFNKK